jgi:hypothetical protein
MMNERIRELAEQAVEETQLLMIMEYKNFESKLYEKFAELIVQECAEVCYDHSRVAGGIDTDFGYGYKDCGNDIKRNFGVEL